MINLQTITYNIKKNIKKILIRFFLYLAFSFFYYLFIILLLKGTFILQEWIIGFICLIIVIIFLYYIFYIIDVFSLKIKIRYLNTYLKIIFIVFLLFPILITYFQTHRLKIGNTNSPNIYSQYQDINFITNDNININGRYLLNNKSDQTIVFAHGLGANKGNFLEYAKIFYNLGYNVFIFDFRGHGNSGGHTISFGYNEKNDILGASEYLKKYYPTKTKKLFGVGYSMGAASIIFAQSDYKIFDKIIIDSSYAYSSNMIDYLYKYLPNYYRIYLKNISNIITQYNIGVAISNINPADKIESIDVPILLFHGKKDSIIPYNESILLKEKIILKNKENKLYLFNNSDHVSGIIDEYDIYLDKVINFLKK